MAVDQCSKVCSSCGESKPRPSFRANRPKCKRCSESGRDQSSEAKARRQANRRASRARASDQHKAQTAAYCKAYQERNREQITATATRWRERNASKLCARYANLPDDKKEESRRRSREWRVNNAERKAEANRRWAQQNQDRMAAYFKKSKEKRRANPTHRIYESISSQVRNAIAHNKDGRGWESIVGYTLTDLIRHLERQFTRGIAWANYGAKWHIDHIIPQADFELRGGADTVIRECWSLSNLRPLPALENLSKGSSRKFLL